jgi:hypothetical protein
MGLRTTDEGELRIAFAAGTNELTRASSDIPDTSDFILTVTDSKGKTIYKGAYGDCPESMTVSAGSYVVNALSSEFEKPAFSSPQYGDEQCVVVPEGGVADVKLTCVQMNAGIRLRIDESFLKNCPSASLFVKAQSGSLMYSYSEKRIAYFLPGPVSVMMSQGGADKVLLTRSLQARSVLEIEISASAPEGGSSQESIKVAVDTSRTWNSESYVIGGGSSGKGNSSSDALTVSQAISSVGAEDVWVCGYIVGGDLTSSSASFEPPFASRTNVILGPRSTSSSRSSCLAVNLPAGDVRDDLNLVDNPSLLGRKVCIRGDIVASYYGLPGLKNMTEFEFVKQY